VYVTSHTPSIVVAVRLLRTPNSALNVSVSPSATGLSLASNTVTLMVLVLIPSAVRFAGVAVTFTLPSAGGPGIKLIVVVSLTPPAVAVILAVPTFVGLVRMAEATPLVVVEL